MSEYSPFNNKKKNFDSILMKYVAKRIFEDVDETDAFNEEIIDSVGNVMKKPTGSNDWAFTHFDRFILALKQNMGQEKLRDLLHHYNWIQDVDSLFIMNVNEKVDFSNLRQKMGKLITQIEDAEYLPMGMEHDNELELEDEELTFCERVSKALTLSTFLLYALRSDNGKGKLPRTVDFDTNIKPSVEVTFNIRSYGTYKECIKYCQDNGFINNTEVTPDGMRKLVALAKTMVESGILVNKEQRVENQTRNWKRLSEK